MCQPEHENVGLGNAPDFKFLMLQVEDRETGWDKNAS